MISGNDIIFYLSGGVANLDPNNSLGGEISTQIISNSINNLFNSVSVDDATEGLIDYRCFYIKNTNNTDTLYNAFLYLSNQFSGGSTIEIGISKETEVQRITISSLSPSGFFTVLYNSNIITVVANDLVGSLQNGLNALDSLSGVSVELSTSGFTTILTISFLEDDNYRSHPLLVLGTNSLSGGAAVSINRLVAGLPINATASSIVVSTNTPSNVNFEDATAEFPITIGTLKGLDYIPVWLRRTTEPGVEAKEQDMVTLNIIGEPFITS